MKFNSRTTSKATATNYDKYPLWNKSNYNPNLLTPQVVTSLTNLKIHLKNTDVITWAMKICYFSQKKKNVYKNYFCLFRCNKNTNMQQSVFNEIPLITQTTSVYWYWVRFLGTLEILPWGLYPKQGSIPPPEGNWVLNWSSAIRCD